MQTSPLYGSVLPLTACRFVYSVKGSMEDLRMNGWAQDEMQRLRVLGADPIHSLLLSFSRDSEEINERSHQRIDSRLYTFECST